MKFLKINNGIPVYLLNDIYPVISSTVNCPKVNTTHQTHDTYGLSLLHEFLYYKFDL